MALIKCPECGRQVSDKAVACPDCGYPIASNRSDGDVLIRIGDFSNNGAPAYAVRSLSVRIKDDSGSILGEGRQGTTVRIHLDKPTRAGFFLHNIGPDNCVTSVMLQPRKKYEMVCIRKMFTVSYVVNELDSIV